MLTGRKMSLWETVSSQMALFANCNRDPKKRSKPFTPADFNPYANKEEDRRRRAIKATPAVMAVMKSMLESSSFKKRK